MSGTIYQSEGQDRLYYPEFSAINNGVAEGLDGDRAVKLFTTIAYNDLTFQGAFVDRKKDLPTSEYGALFNQAGSFNIDQRAYLDLKYTQKE